MSMSLDERLMFNLPCGIIIILTKTEEGSGIPIQDIRTTRWPEVALVALHLKVLSSISMPLNLALSEAWIYLWVKEAINSYSKQVMKRSSRYGLVQIPCWRRNRSYLTILRTTLHKHSLLKVPKLNSTTQAAKVFQTSPRIGTRELNEFWCTALKRNTLVMIDWKTTNILS